MFMNSYKAKNKTHNNAKSASRFEVEGEDIIALSRLIINDAESQGPTKVKDRIFQKLLK